jgi:hypothetical protein
MKVIVSYSRTNGLEKLHLGTTDSGKGVYEGVDVRPPRDAQKRAKVIAHDNDLCRVRNLYDPHEKDFHNVNLGIH